MNNFLRQHIEKIVSLTDEEFALISQFFTTKKLKKHQFLVQESENVNSIYLIFKGCLKAYYLDSEGKEYILQFGIEDWWISDFQAFFTQTKANLYVDCLEDSEFFVLSYENREKLCAKFHKMEYFFRLKANFGYAALQQRILSLLNKDAKSRYQQFASTYPHLLNRLPKRLIASYLGVSRETLSRFSLE